MGQGYASSDRAETDRWNSCFCANSRAKRGDAQSQSSEVEAVQDAGENHGDRKISDEEQIMDNLVATCRGRSASNAGCVD